MVADAAGLGEAVVALLSDDVVRLAMAERATAALEAERGALERTMTALAAWPGLPGAGGLCAA
jgi:3-deoxy-D-manno-octulosonic-acid transferase